MSSKVLMDLLRNYIWLWVIIGMIFVSVVISVIFLLINKCISRGGKHRISQLHRGFDINIESNKYQERNFKDDIPPLPPRTQFLTAEAQSYENLAEVPDYEQITADYEQITADYEQSMPDYEQNLDDQSDYVKVEDEEKILPPPPPYEDPDPAEDNASTEDYDDIGGESQNEEDYDDLG